MRFESSTDPEFVSAHGYGPFGGSLTVGPDPGLIATAATARRRRSRAGAAVLLGVSAALLMVLSLPGLLLWWPSATDATSRANLGANLLGGSIVAFSVMLVQLLVTWRIHRREQTGQRRAERAELTLQLSLREDFVGIDLAWRDLSGFYLRRKKLAGARLVAATLDFADLSSAGLAEADLSGATLEHTRFDRCDLSGARLSAARGIAASLRSANLRGARMDHMRLPLSDLGGADLRDCDLTGANLNSCDLAGTDLRGATLDGAQLMAPPASRARSGPTGSTLRPTV